MIFLEKIYNISPIILQNLMVSISGYIRNRKRYGETYKKHIAFLREFDNFSLEKKLEFQEKELINFIHFAYNESDFYKKFYSDIDINEIKNIADLKKLPILDKETLRSNFDTIKTINRKKAIEGHTGGTTGKSLIVYFTPDDMMKRMAMLDHFKARVGFQHLKMSRATFNGKHIVPQNQKRNIYWRYNAACKQMIYSSFHMSESNMEYYVKSLNKFKPMAIDGFFMSIVDIANYIDRHKIKLDFTPIAVFPTSETLTQNGREMIERVFKCKVYDQYASSEGAPFITECKDQKLHIELSTGVFEYFEDKSTEVLVTSFSTHGTPLIRYKIGDSIILNQNESKKCTCNNESILVKEIIGRRLDFLLSDSGTRISTVNIANGFKNIPNAIIRAQVIQEKLGEINILLEVDEKRYKKQYDIMLINEFKQKFGNKTNIVIRHVNEIPREKSGKFKLVVNKIKNS